MGKVTISGRGRRRVLRGHPWIYADDVAEGAGEPGELLPVFAPDNTPLGWGLFSTHSRIAVRLVTDSATQPDRAFWASRVGQAIEARSAAGLLAEDGACRLIAGDADGVPGLVVDRYADVLVMQSGCQASDRMLPFVQELIEEIAPFPIRAVFDRSDSSVRRHEALEPRTEWRKGERGDAIEIVEEGEGVPRLVYEVDVTAGHKTGHYLDQRDNRAYAATYAARGEGAVLDVFSYDGLFGIRAALRGAKSVLCLDQSEAAGERCLRNAERNGVADRVRFEKVKALDDLRRRVEAEEQYDLVIIDPPAFARNKREADGAVRGYREVNRRALELARVGGVVVTASCSYNIDRQTFTQCLADASSIAHREARIFRFSGAAADHPVLATLPESDYLKCAFVRAGK